MPGGIAQMCVQGTGCGTPSTMGNRFSAIGMSANQYLPSTAIGFPSPTDDVAFGIERMVVPKRNGSLV